EDPAVDGTLVIFTPQAGVSAAAVAETLVPHAQGRKPLLASWMGGGEAGAGAQRLNAAGIPTFEFPDTAARVFTAMWRHTYAVRALYETPTLPEDQPGLPNRAR